MPLPNTRLSDRLFLVLAVGAALFALFMHFGIASTNISRAEWDVPAAFIKKKFKQGDVIGLIPHWALKAAERLRPAPFLFAEHLAREDLSRYRRLWVLVAPRLGKWWFQRSFKRKLKSLRRRYWMRKQWRFGKVEVYLFQLPPPRPLLYDFLAKKHLRRAEVGLEVPAGAKRQRGCPASTVGEIEWLKRWREHPGWHMGRRGYFFGRVIQEIHNTPRDCLLAYPQRCKVLRVRYRNVPLQGEIQLQHGFSTPAPGGIVPGVKPAGPDVMLSLWVENQFVRTFRISDRQRWRTHWFDLSTLKLPQSSGSVEFHIQTPQRQTSRTGYCFRAEIRKILSRPPKRKTP